MRFFLLFLVLFINLLASSQTDFNQFKNIESQGDIGTYLKEYVDINHVSNSFTTKKNKKKDKAFYIKNLVNSGYLVFGDEVSQYLQVLCDKILQSNDLNLKLQVVWVKSNMVCTFNDSKNLLFVTSGLIAQSTNEDELLYLIAREIDHLVKKHPIPINQSNEKTRIANLVSILSAYSLENELSSDVDALTLFLKTGSSSGNLKNVINVLFLSQLPYEDLSFQNNYFNSKNYLIPNEVLIGDRMLFKEEFKTSELKPHESYIKRMENFAPKLDLSSASKVTNELYTNIRLIVRFDLLKTDIEQGDFVKNIYHIYVLEKSYPESSYLKLMKAHSWYGLLQYKIGNINHVFDNSIYHYKNESIFFQYFINRLNIYGIASLTLRTIYDLKDQLPGHKEIDLIYSKVIKTLSETAYFDIGKFYEFNLLETKKLIAENDTKNKYEKNEPFKNNQLLIDTLSFYLYGIPDIIKDENFKQLYSFYKKGTSNKLSISSKEIDIPFYQFSYYKKFRYDPAKSDKIKKKIVNEKQFLNVSIQDQNAEFSLTEFNKIALYKRLLEQIELFRNNKTDVVALDYSRLANETDQRLTLIPIYESYLKFHLKNYQTAAFLILPLGAAINDFFLNNHKSCYKTLIFDNATGTVSYYANIENRLLMNRFTVLNYLYNLRNSQ